MIDEFHFESVDFEVSLGHPVGNLDHEFRKNFRVGDLCLEVVREEVLILYTFEFAWEGSSKQFIERVNKSFKGRARMTENQKESNGSASSILCSRHQE